ncbi:acyl carrier protein [Streptomyces sp. ODS05-4]|uniref:acyl carrier protein n=1 Tax=Streptomyces sp. ODS05-4 TaxID=2944939 RepID=UPI00210A0689|nr:acyl carrier protein [Streptomyces sp. ODS05-4]
MTDELLHTLTPLLRARAESQPPDLRELTPETRLEQDLGMDSMTIVHVLEDIEESFDFTIPDERLAGVYTVGDLVDIVRTTGPAAAGRAA